MDTVFKIKYIMNNVCSISKDRIEAIVLSMHDEEDCGRLLHKFSEFYNDLLIESDILIKHKETYNTIYDEGQWHVSWGVCNYAESKETINISISPYEPIRQETSTV